MQKIAIIIQNSPTFRQVNNVEFDDFDTTFVEKLSSVDTPLWQSP